MLRENRTVNAIHGHVMVLADRLPPSDVQPKESQRVEELPDSWTGANDEPSHKHAKQGDWTIAHTTTFKSTALLQQMMPGCPKDCRCGCHARPKRRRNEGLVGNLLGYLGVQYDLPSRDAGQDNRCICGEQIWRVEYRPPPWLDARVWLLSWSLGTAGPVYSLRPARVIPLRSILWTRIGQSAQAMRHSITLGDAVYPDDRNETGQELIEVRGNWSVLCGDSLTNEQTIITERSFDVLELLLVEWKNILRRKGFSR